MSGVNQPQGASPGQKLLHDPTGTRAVISGFDKTLRKN